MALSFWFATLPARMEVLRGHAEAFDPALREAIESGRADRLALELIRDDDNPKSLALLISVADADRLPGRLTCWMAFASDLRWCDRLRSIGVPLLEAELALGSHDELALSAAVYPTREGGAPVTLSKRQLIRIRGVRFDAGAEPDTAAMSTFYAQFKTTPDVARQTRDLMATPFSWTPTRSRLRPLHGQSASLHIERSAWPDLVAVLEAGPHPGVATLAPLMSGRLHDPSGLFEDPPAAGSPAAPAPSAAAAPIAAPKPVVARIPAPASGPGPAPRRLPSATIFGAPVFQFEDVELVGFRINLPSSRLPELQALVEPLNFHRETTGAGNDFRWRVATTTVVIELLHYGRMESRSPLAPLMPRDFMAQHELIVRLLVGKVDDDGSQARDASMFVPAIFVDNPWSKAAGRETQGMPKEIAQFCIRGADGADHPLGMDGKAPDGSFPPLTRVAHVRTPRRFDAEAQPDSVLRLDYPPNLRDDEASFEAVDLSALLSSSVFGGSRWRQGDFGQREFRRSFARDAMHDGFQQFRSVQVTPVDDRGLPKAWIQGHFRLKNMRAQVPAGVAVLEACCDGRAADDPWSRLCQLLPRPEISLPNGDWYRLRCDMDLSISDSLDW